MFNEKQRQIDELREKARQCKEEHGPWINLAKELGERVLKDEAIVQADFTVHITRVMEMLAEEKRTKKALKTFDALPVEQRWQIMADLFDDDTIRDVLAERRAALDNLSAHQRQLRVMAVESKAAGRFDMSSVPEGSEVTIELVDPDYLPDKLDSSVILRSHIPDRRIRSLGLGDGNFHVIKDEIPAWDGDEDKKPKPNLNGHAISRFGTTYHGNELLATLFRGAAVSCEHKNELKQLYVNDSYCEEDEIYPVLYDITIDGVSMLTDTSDNP